MIKPELYNRTVDILVQAYFNDTLECTDCTACAVGNIVASNLGLKLVKSELVDEHSVMNYLPIGFKEGDKNFDSGLWAKVISGGVFRDYHVDADIQFQIDKTGYTGEQLTDIEDAFMDAHSHHKLSNEQRMFDGLLAVIDVLDKIHQNTDTQVTAQTKLKFKKQLTNA